MSLPVAGHERGGDQSPERSDAKAPTVQRVSDVVIRFAGDSGDGMQLTGSQFTNTSAVLGNDLSTLPDFPAEIRAPAGTLPGVSAFQVRIADYDIHTPGDTPDVLVAMNPAALIANLGDLQPNSAIIANTDEFNERNFKKAGLEGNPLEDGSLSAFRVFTADITTMTRKALEDSDLDVRTKDRCKNLFALGMVYWLYSRPLENTVDWLQLKFKRRPEIAEANIKVLKAGWNFCDITQLFQVRYEVEKAALEPGTYRNIHGNSALAMGLVAASRRSGLPLFLGAYPITPASDVLHELATYKRYGVTTFQAEDEIAAVCAAIGASFGGALGVTCSSGPGIALKSEAMNLAVMVELPLVVCDIQRGGPSTGLPTKTEQSDLLQVLFGRNGDSPVPVIAAARPSDCFEVALEAVRIATRYMVPVVLLSDGYIANGSEPWRLPEIEDLPDLRTSFHDDPETFLPYMRDERTLARPWAIPGTPGLEHRIGGLEKADVTGKVSYDPHNHERMTRLRAEKVARVVQDVPDLEVHGDPDGGELLVLGWGSTLGAITGAVNQAREQGKPVSRAHLRWLNPFPANLGEVLARFDKVLLPEMNMGQLALLLRGHFLIDVQSYTKIEGKPFTRQEISDQIDRQLGASRS
ncbi:MAG: 2-oxoacid:acceptor oxidoreductase subunit alpha [Acidobacteria bacterium]|nr:MAG: 2-oxoacid:acceptor oxidoreductase subunit alpha [Acidobacteriota bacterium]REK07849.1 MAG: 2-oxoacid:acceptor oxidoreductase subunit alpha [Acidobacteriota bacterium]